jgi:serine/threonine protein phosphatase PrpC
VRYTWASATSVGLVRDGNEDSVRPTADGSAEAPIVVAIADGMGGAVAGEVASKLAIDAATATDAAATTTPRQRVLDGNKAVIRAIAEDFSLAGMGTTLTLGRFTENGTLQIGHVGDSRMYLLRNGTLSQLTTDHTLVAELLALGRITPAQAKTHPRRNLITRVVGTHTLEVEEVEHQLESGDRIMLCSDGLTDMVTDDDIAAILHKAESPTEAAWSLVEAANAAGGIDNTTVAVVDVSP